MARHWKEKLDPSKHRDFMRGYQDAGGIPLDGPRDILLQSWAYFVEVAGFTFQFVSVDQIFEALRYFEKRPTRVPKGPTMDWSITGNRGTAGCPLELSQKPSAQK